MRRVALGVVVLAAAGVARADDPVSEATEAATRARPRRVTIAAVGDVLFGRYLRSGRYRRVSAADDPFAGTSAVLAGADLAFANAECPFMDEPDDFVVHERSLTFRCEPSDAEVMAAAGFDVVSAANNHTLNLGHHGAAETPRQLEAAGLVAVGAGATEADAFEAQVVDAGGARVAFLAFTGTVNGRTPVSDDGAVAFVSHKGRRRKLVERVEAARDELAADFLVVSLHWGGENERHPRDHQVRIAHALVDAGADLVIGHHPHVVQDVERYRGALIAYSLGNFLFDNPAESQRRSVILEATLERDGDGRRVAGATLHPVVIDRDWRARSSVPKLATGSVYRRWKRELRQLARELAIAPAPAR